MPNSRSSHQGGSSSNRSRDDIRCNAYQAVSSRSNAMHIDFLLNPDNDISRLPAQSPEDDIVTGPDRLESSSSGPGGSSSRHRNAVRTSPRRNATGSSGGRHSSGSGHSRGSGRSGGAAPFSHAGLLSDEHGDRGVSSRATASREAGTAARTIWQCNLCPRSYGNRHGLTEHINRVHRGPYRCRVGCQQEFTNSKSRKRHEETLHTARENAPWRCTLCNCSLRNQRALTNHYISGHPITKELKSLLRIDK